MTRRPHQRAQELVERLRQDPVGAFTGESVAAIERSEVARLQKELQRVRAERDILKKAVAYFAKDQQ